MLLPRGPPHALYICQHSFSPPSSPSPTPSSFRWSWDHSDTSCFTHSGTLDSLYSVRNIENCVEGTSHAKRLLYTPRGGCSRQEVFVTAKRQHNTLTKNWTPHTCKLYVGGY